MEPVTLGVIVGNRGFFPDHLCVTGRATILKVLEAQGIKAVILDESVGVAGSLPTDKEARQCADLFRAHRDEIDGILITLPNFGEERPIANAVRWADLNVPVLVHAFPEDMTKMTIADRRDSFCGKMSACNNLTQYGITFSLTAAHTVDPESPAFAADLQGFAATCRIVKGLKGARLGAIGARPAAFNTVRFSEKLFERSGITVDTLDLSEVIGRAGRLADDDASVAAKIAAMTSYVSTDGTPPASLLRMAKLGVVIDDWMKSEDLVASAIQCWDAMEQFYGIVPCTLMSMMSNDLMPSACEMDIAGLVGMYTMTLASGEPSAIVDWNNNFGDDPDKAVIFHCSNLPKKLFLEQNAAMGDAPKMGYQAIIAGSVGRENAYGTIEGRLKPVPITYLRVSTDDLHGCIRSYLGTGDLTDDTLRTFGGYGVVRIPNMQKLLAHICQTGFEHHVAINPAVIADPIQEAYEKYLGWTVYRHE